MPDFVVSLGISLMIAILIVAICAWVGDWFGVRIDADEERFWDSVTLDCPNCRSRYSDGDIRSRSRFCADDGPDGVYIRCSRCLECARFSREENEACFDGWSYQWRSCGECGELYNGDIETACPVCGAVNSKPVEPQPA